MKNIIIKIIKYIIIKIKQFDSWYTKYMGFFHKNGMK